MMTIDTVQSSHIKIITPEEFLKLRDAFSAKPTSIIQSSH